MEPVFDNLGAMNSEPSDIIDITEDYREDKPQVKPERLTPGQTVTKTMIVQKTKQRHVVQILRHANISKAILKQSKENLRN